LRAENTSNLKTTLKNSTLSVEKTKSKKENEALKKGFKEIPKLNLESLKKNNLDEVKFFTPREHKKMT